MKLKNVINAILIFIGIICIDFVGTYAYSELKADESGGLKIHYIDVGQGDSTFIELPDGKTILIDAGEAEYGSTVVNYIKKLKYQKIDYIFATHPHNDHIGGLTKVINSFEIGTIYMPDVYNNTNGYLNLLNAIKAKNKTIKKAIALKNVILNDDLSLKIIGKKKEKYDDLNNYSIVLKLTYKEKSFIFMADAEYESEMEILNSQIDIKADVLKVGHHGSTSSTNYNFLKKVNPSIAVISVGLNNDYGHPKEKILEKLKNNNIKIYRTDINGNIIITTDGDKLKVKVENGSYS